MSLRIVAGDLRGRRIRVPPGRQVRPTGDRVREAWFSALGDRIVGATVIDLFAGSGALGIEALSSGASTVQFVEEDRRCVEILRENVDTLGLTARVHVHRADVFGFSETQRRVTVRSGACRSSVRKGDSGETGCEFHRRPFAECCVSSMA